MIPTFENALEELLLQYCHKPLDEMIVVMELALDGMHHQAKFEASAPAAGDVMTDPFQHQRS